MNTDILKGLADNQALMDALCHAINREFALNEVSLAMPNEAIGQVVRANIMGRTIVDDCFKKILALKTAPEKFTKSNPGR